MGRPLHSSGESKLGVGVGSAPLLSQRAWLCCQWGHLAGCKLTDDEFSTIVTSRTRPTCITAPPVWVQRGDELGNGVPGDATDARREPGLKAEFDGTASLSDSIRIGCPFQQARSKTGTASSC